MKIPDAIMVGGAVSFRYKVPASHTDYIEDSGEYSLIIPKRQTASDMSIDYEKETVSIGGGYSYYIGANAPGATDNYNVAAADVSLDLGAGGLNKIVEQGQTENKIYYYVSAIAGTLKLFSSAAYHARIVLDVLSGLRSTRLPLPRAGAS